MSEEKMVDELPPSEEVTADASTSTEDVTTDAPSPATEVMADASTSTEDVTTDAPSPATEVTADASTSTEEVTTDAPSPATGFQAKVTEFIENMINPSLSAHGGWVEVMTASDETGVVEMKMGGGCHGCGASAQTMQYGIQTALMEEFPQISEVVDVTDHTTGENPFFMGNPFAGM